VHQENVLVEQAQDFMKKAMQIEQVMMGKRPVVRLAGIFNTGVENNTTIQNKL